jgi:hypothetical protein
MQTLLHILEKAGGFRPSLYLSIENPPFLALVVEALDESGLSKRRRAFALFSIWTSRGTASNRSPQRQARLRPMSPPVSNLPNCLCL